MMKVERSCELCGAKAKEEMTKEGKHLEGTPLRLVGRLKNGYTVRLCAACEARAKRFVRSLLPVGGAA
jgi:hypothetical protein